VVLHVTNVWYIVDIVIKDTVKQSVCYNVMDHDVGDALDVYKGSLVAQYVI